MCHKVEGPVMYHCAGLTSQSGCTLLCSVYQQHRVETWGTGYVLYISNWKRSQFNSPKLKQFRQKRILLVLHMSGIQCKNLKKCNGDNNWNHMVVSNETNIKLLVMNTISNSAKNGRKKGNVTMAIVCSGSSFFWRFHQAPWHLLIINWLPLPGS